MFVSIFRSVDFALLFFLASLQLGFPSTPDNNEEVNFNDGFHMFGGDIVLTEEQAQALLVVYRSTVTPHPPARHSRAVLTVESKKWPDGEVPYRISNNLNDTVKDAIVTSMQQIRRDTDSSILFRPALPDDDSFIYFFRGNGCYSNVGRLGGQQNISIGSLCGTNGLIMHEILHALGRWHEHSRPDRNSFVTVNTDNIREGFQDNFKIVEDGDTSTQGMAYDFDSIMHYDAYAFSSNSQPTITPLDSRVRLDRLGQRRLLSDTDVQHLKAMYPPKDKSEWSRWSSWSACSHSCGTGMRSRSRMCISEGEPCIGSPTQQDACNQQDCPMVPVEWGAWSSWSGCSQTCGKGQRSRFRDCRLANQDCKGSKLEVGECTIKMCVEESEWSPWSPWSQCSPAPNRTRRRTCRAVISKMQLQNMNCRGVASETESCPMDLSCSGLSNRSKCDGCTVTTCLSGLRRLGCRRVYWDQLKESEMIVTTHFTAAREGTSDRALHSCGKAARNQDGELFALNKTSCIVGLELSMDTLEKCDEREDARYQAFELYYVTNKEDFDLSLRAYDSCGSAYCLPGSETLQSSATSTQSHLFMAFSFIFWLLY